MKSGCILNANFTHLFIGVFWVLGWEIGFSIARNKYLGYFPLKKKVTCKHISELRPFLLILV